MKYILILISSFWLTACSEAPQDPHQIDMAEESHAHEGEDAHAHDGDADHAHETTETEVFYGNEAETAAEVGAGGPAVTGMEHEHAEDADHHHEEGDHAHEQHDEVHAQEGDDHHHEDGADDHHH